MSLSASQPSLWLARGASPEEVEIAVVGGGIVGLSTAYWLSRGGRKVVLLEADSVAAHASGRNAGYLMTGTPEPYAELVRHQGERAARRLWEVSLENRELLRSELLDSNLVDCGFQPEGSWIAALSDTDQEASLRESAGQLEKLGIPLEWRSAAEVRKASGSERLGGAIFQARDAGLDPARLCRGIARIIVSLGGEIRTGWPVRAIEPEGPEGERVRLVSEAGHLVAERVVLALNAYAPALLPHLAAEVRPVRAQMLATEPGPRDLPGVWYINEGYEYLRQLPDGTVALGGCRWAAREQEVGYRETPTAAVQGALERFLAEAFPRFAGRAVRHRWAGTMAFTPDGVPRIGEVPGVPGALYAAGFNGHGMSLGFSTGRYLAQRLRREGGEASAPLFA
jgi:gamma-glutamylputrescine oxidase